MDGLSITYDVTADLVVIEGIQYTGELFRQMAFAEPGTWLRIEERSDGALTLDQVSDAMGRTFDAISGRQVVQ